MRVPLIDWLALARVIGFVVLARIMRGRANATRLDVGSVSDQWIAEHRAGQNNGSGR